MASFRHDAALRNFSSLCEHSVRILGKMHRFGAHMTLETEKEKRTSGSFKGIVIPLGSKIAYKPINPKAEARLHHLGTRMLPGSFLGVLPQCSGEDVQVGDLLMAD